MSEFIAMFRGLIKPKEYIGSRPDFTGFMIRMTIILVVCALVLALTRWLGPEDIISITSMELARLAQRSGPIGRLLFPVFWLLFFMFAASLRWLGIHIMDESNKSFKDAFMVTAFAYLPMILISGLMGGIMNNLFPASIAPGDTLALFSLRNIVQVLMLAVTFLWELFIWNHAGRQLFEQNRGRAFLTFMIPYFFGIVFCCAPMVLLLNLAN